MINIEYNYTVAIHTCGMLVTYCHIYHMLIISSEQFYWQIDMKGGGG